MATSCTRSPKKPAGKGSAHARALKRLCKLEETPIATPKVLAMAGGDMTSSAGVMVEALKLTDALTREAQQVTEIRQRLIDLPAAHPVAGEHVGEHVGSPIL